MDAELLHDLIFLDIQMRGIDGNVTARELRKYNAGAVLVFCSGVSQPTPDSIKVAPYRYLLKGFKPKETKEELKQIVTKMMSVPRHDFLVAKKGREIVRLPVSSVIYISKMKHGSKIHYRDMEDKLAAKELASETHITDFFRDMKEYGFAFPHDSYIVNLRWVKAFTNEILVLDDGSKTGLELNISRSKKDDFRKRFIAYWDKYGGMKK